MEQQNIKNRSINYVSVFIETESGCDIAAGEYFLKIGSQSNALDISSVGGVDDISLIKDCIENNINSFILPDEGTTELILKEDGEWEDVFWHKYYIVERICVL
ncbi:hypothetical protein MNBD_GAMMA01-1293 [hydrothermal vent metagenome]|uniref:Uncharacterized protein n=1 Tax=hydrothermal vent metagenome TaxID=652676 RepID=A0A3B0V5N9_9ZZZZ